MAGISGQIIQGSVYVKSLTKFPGKGVQGTLELTSSFPRELINNTLRERTRDHRTPRDEHFTVR